MNEQKKKLVESMDSIVMKTLKRKYAFFYRQLQLEARPHLEGEAENAMQEALEGKVNENLHIEYHQGNHSTASSTLTSSDVLDAVKIYNEEIAEIQNMYIGLNL